MHSNAAFIGHQPHISIAELAAAVPGFTLEGILDKSVVLFGSAVPLERTFLDNLGGTVTLAAKAEGKLALPDVPALLERQVQGVKGKVTFSLRCHGLSPREVRDLYRDCKSYLKRKGRPARYVGNERKAAATVLLRDEGILDGKGGCEIVVIRGKDLFWVGMTTAAQDIDAYTKRDMEKPVRDTTVGLLPPKLAQVLLNLGLWLAPPLPPALKAKGKSKEEPVLYAVLDPFCGTGVIPMECLLRGYAVLASDKSEKAVTGCQRNLDWLRRQMDIKKSEVPSSIWKQDATKPFDAEGRPDVIVTETSLGPNLRSRPTAKDAQKLRGENDKLQEAFLKNMAACFPGVSLVCTWPVWYYSKGPTQLERAWAVAEKLGYEAVLPPQIVSTTGHQSLIYRRPDQFVGREIVLLRAKKK